MLDQETKKEVVEDILLHYGVRGMKWKKEKKKEEVKEKMNGLFDKTDANQHRKNKLTVLKRKVETDVEDKTRSNRARKQNEQIGEYVKTLSKKQEVRSKEQKEWDNRPITKKVLDQLKGKKRPKYLTPFDNNPKEVKPWIKT